MIKASVPVNLDRKGGSIALASGRKMTLQPSVVDQLTSSNLVDKSINTPWCRSKNKWGGWEKLLELPGEKGGRLRQWGLANGAGEVNSGTEAGQPRHKNVNCITSQEVTINDDQLAIFLLKTPPYATQSTSQFVTRQTSWPVKT